MLWRSQACFDILCMVSPVTCCDLMPPGPASGGRRNSDPCSLLWLHPGPMSAKSARLLASAPACHVCLITLRKPEPSQVATDRRVLGSLEVLDSKPRTFPPGKEHRCLGAAMLRRR